MTTRNVIAATAGHVDHGKSSLVKALTGVDPDRLPEEKARGITIDLGFAHLQLDDPKTGTRYSIGLVDVPGHEDFVKNMVAGVGSIDLALLVVAADDGWMPQTEEHFQILNYLRVQRLIVALTKVDLAEDEAGATANIRARLAGSPFPDAEIVPTSVVSGRGLEGLKNALIETLATTPLPRSIGKPRLPVDRMFTLQGVGVVITGTLAGGELRKGQSVIVQPSGLRARIRRIHSYNRDVDVSVPGARTALNLSDLSASDIHRGDTITVFEDGASDTWDVLLERAGRSTTRPIKDGATVRVHFGSANSEARVILLDAKTLAAGEQSLAQIRFDQPVFAFVGDAFIVRDSAEQFTLAGGIILSERSGRRRLRDETHKQFLRARAEFPNDPSVYVSSQLVRDGFVKTASLLVHSNFSRAEISEAIQKLGIMPHGEVIAESSWWSQLIKQAADAIDQAHRQNPDRPGLPLADLRARLDVPEEVFAPLLADLSKRGFVQLNADISRSAHKLALPPQIQKAAAQVRNALAAKPLDPPSVKEIATDAASQQALAFLVQTGDAIEVSKEIVLLASAYEQAVNEVRNFLSGRGAGTTSELRQRLGTSRRVIIPLLEFLDKKGVTRREGDQRVLR